MIARNLFLPILLAVPAMATQSLAGESNPVIVHLAFRDQIVSVHSGNREPSYTVRDASGRVLSARLSSHQLLAQHPELYERINSAVAGSANSFIWAGMNRPGPVSVPTSRRFE